MLESEIQPNYELFRNDLINCPIKNLKRNTYIPVNLAPLGLAHLGITEKLDKKHHFNVRCREDKLIRMFKRL